MTMEPLVVEYLVLEKECARKSIFERFPPTWTWIRQFGFSRTKSKIEALWAFIEAHEMSMKEFPSLSQHFPEVATCMEDIITETSSTTAAGTSSTTSRPSRPARHLSGF